MNAISYALTVIKRKIPKEILEQTFLTNQNYVTTIPVSVDSRIKELVIRDIVLKDVNIIGGTHITVPLQGLPMEPFEGDAVVVRIPKDRTQGRSIITVHSVALGVASNMTAFNQANVGQGGELASATQQMIAAISSIPYMSEAQCMLLSDNVVMIQGGAYLSGNTFLRCEVENDANLNNIKRRSYLTFGELCTLACKSYIYNNNAIPMDIGYIKGGANMGRMKDIIDSYDNAEEEYIEMLRTKWAKVNKLNDAETVEQLVRITAGGIY